MQMRGSAQSLCVVILASIRSPSPNRLTAETKLHTVRPCVASLSLSSTTATCSSPLSPQVSDQTYKYRDSLVHHPESQSAMHSKGGAKAVIYPHASSAATIPAPLGALIWDALLLRASAAIHIQIFMLY